MTSGSGSTRVLTGLLVDPLEGARTGRLTLQGGLIAAVEELEAAPAEPVICPGFVDLHVYEPASLAEQGVTAYLQAGRHTDLELGPACLGIHLEGPFLNPAAAGAIPVEELRPVDLGLLGRWLLSGRVRLVTVAPELPGALEAIALVVAHGAVAGLGHTHANAATTRAAIEVGARFATHLWNGMAPLRSRSTGPVAELLLDGRVTLGLIADGRHLHPRVEELTVRLAGPDRIALTSDLVAPPALSGENRLLGGDRAGAALVRRMARFGLAEAVGMASLVPSRLLALADHGRLVPGARADLALLDAALEPLETVVEGQTVWRRTAPAEGT